MKSRSTRSPSAISSTAPSAQSGSFYARFDDKWALLRTVIHRYLEQIRDFMDNLLDPDEWATYPVGEMVTVTSRAAVGLYQAHGHIFRAGLAFSATDDVARRALVAHYAYMRQRIGRAVLEHPDVTATPELVKRVDLAIEASGAILDTRLLFSWRDGGADWETVAEEIEVLFLRVSTLG